MLHPDPYIVPYRPGGSMYARNPPFPEVRRRMAQLPLLLLLHLTCSPLPPWPHLSLPPAPPTQGIHMHMDFGREGYH